MGSGAVWKRYAPYIYTPPSIDILNRTISAQIRWEFLSFVEVYPDRVPPASSACLTES